MVLHRLILAIVLASMAFTILFGVLPMSGATAQAHAIAAHAHRSTLVRASLSLLPRKASGEVERKTMNTSQSLPGSATASARKSCPGGDLEHAVTAGETLSAIAFRAGTSWAMLANHNHLLQANIIQVGQILCIPMRSSPSSDTIAFLQHTQPEAFTATEQGNFFPYGQCTWWANQRYYEKYGVYIPWTSNADAWQWTARAYDYGWHVSLRPTIGAIIDLQPWVQGAYGAGHVAVVEQVLSDGSVITSNMNWGATPSTVTNVQFAPGPGVTFLTR